MLRRRHVRRLTLRVEQNQTRTSRACELSANQGGWPEAKPGEAFKLFRDSVDVRDAVIALRRSPAEVEVLYTDWERLDDMLLISPRVRFQLSRMVAQDPLPVDVLEAIEDDDADSLRDIISDLIENA